jgi:hypothetical protein
MHLLGVRIRVDTSCLDEIMSSINRSKQTLSPSGCKTQLDSNQQTHKRSSEMKKIGRK